MKFIKKLTAFLIGLSIFSAQQVSAGTKYFSDGFENGNGNWSFYEGPSVSSGGESASMALEGKNNICVITEGNYSDASVSAVVHNVSFSKGYVGAALRAAEDSRYELRFYSGSVKIVRIHDNKESVIAAENLEVFKDGRIKFAAKGGVLRAELNGSTVLSAIDKNALSAGAVAIVSNEACAEVRDVTVAEESSYLYETFENGKFISFKEDSQTPQSASDMPGGGFEVRSIENKGVLCSKSSEDNCRILYNTPSDASDASYAVIMGVKSDAWEAVGENGISFLSRYIAPNKTYKLKIEGGRFIIEKLSVGAVSSLAASETLKTDGAAYHELAFETINNSDGSVLLSAYIDGKKVVTATDLCDTYRNGKFGLEKNGFADVRIDYINLRATDKKSTLEESYIINSEIKEITLEVDGSEVTPDMPLQLSGNSVMMTVTQMANILQTPFVGNDKSGFFEKDGLRVELTAGSDIAVVNGGEVKMPACADSRNKIMTAPAQFVMGLYGAVVSFNKETMILSVSYSSSIISGTSLYTKHGNVFAISPDGKTFRYAKVSGVDGHYRSNNQAVWRAYFIDEKTEAINKKLEAERKSGWGANWQLGSDICTSNSAALQSAVWDEKNGLLTLCYNHPRVDVTVYVKFGENRLEISCDAVNKDDCVLQYFCAVSEWSYCYSKNNTLLLPRSYAMTEYSSCSWFNYNSHNTIMDGFAVTGSGVMSTYNIQHEYKDGDDEHIMATETQMYTGEFPRSIRLYSGTVLYREKGQSFKTVPIAIVASENLRAYADDYVNTCYPGTRKIMDKIIDAQDKETIPKSNILRLNAIDVKFSDMAKVIPHLPGHSMFHSTAVLGWTNKKYGYWDAFPNYFPPIESSGTMEDYENYFRTARENGHSYLPRTSLFYGTDGSQLDLDLQKEGMTINDIAISNINREPQRAYYGVPGVIYSPASKRAVQFFEETWNQWNKMSVTNFFTNVIAVVTPMYMRYDFHPDAESPDYMYDYQAKLMKWHGDRAPVYSEGMNGIRIPYQAGFMTDAKWDPDLDPALTANGAIRTRYDIPALILSEYAKIFSHNVSNEQQVSNRALTFSLLYNYGLKMRLNLKEQPSESNMQWIRAHAILGELVMSRLYGARLEKEIDYSSDVLTANYSGNIITGTLSEKPIKSDDRTISKEGFEFVSADKKVIAGTYDSFNNHDFDCSTLLLFENTDYGSLKIYAPTSQKAFVINVPADRFANPQAKAYFADGTSRELDVKFDGKNLQFTYPYCDLSDGEPIVLDNGVEIKTSKIVPYVELSEGNTKDREGIINISASLPIDAYNSFEALPDVIPCRIFIENPGKYEMNGTVTVKGTYMGNNVEKDFPVNGNETENSLIVKLEKNAFSTDSGAELTVDAVNLPIEKPIKVVLKKRDTSMLASTLDLELSKYKIKLDWNTAAPLPETVTLTTDGINTGGSCYEMKKGQSFKISDTVNFALKTTNAANKYYIETLIRITDSARYRYSGNAWQNVIKVSGPDKTTPMLLKYGAFDNTLSLSVTDINSTTVTLPKNPRKDAASPDVVPGEWMHIIMEVNGSDVRFCIDGREFRGKLNSSIGKTDGIIEIGGAQGVDIAYLRIAR